MFPAGWYADPDDSALLRYWDGDAWTSHTALAHAPEPVDFRAHLRWEGNRVIAPAASIAAGLTPAGCVPHGRSGRPTRVKFISRTPSWAYLTLVVGLIWPVIIGALLRKTVTAPSWPVCQKCFAERRRNLTAMWVSIGSWVPALVIVANIPATIPVGATMLLVAVLLLAPLFATVWFHEHTSLTRAADARVSDDGSTVSFAGQVFARKPSEAEPVTG